MATTGNEGGRPKSSNLNLGGLGSLRLYELTAAEKLALRRVLNAAIETGMFSRRELERTCQVGLLRYIVGPDDPEPKRGRKKVSVRYDKWVRLYNYVMTDVLKEAQRLQEESVLRKIRTLHRLGIESHRYDSDNNLFTQKYLDLDTAVATVDSTCTKGCYVVFRPSSNNDCLRTGMVQIRLEPNAGRYVFESRLAHEDLDRHSNGIVYALGSGHLALVGFLNKGQGLETYTLFRADDSFDILFGIMTTSGSMYEPHSKQCCFIRARRIGIADLSDSVFVMPRAWERTRDDLRATFENWPRSAAIELKNPYKRVFLSQYISENILHFRNNPPRVDDGADAQSGPPY